MNRAISPAHSWPGWSGAVIVIGLLIIFQSMEAWLCP